MRTASLSGRLLRYFGSLFLVAMGGLGLVWYYGSSGLGFPGARQQAIEAALRQHESSADFQLANLRSHVQERRGDLLMLAQSKPLLLLLASPAKEVQPEIERLYEQLDQAYPDRYHELEIVDPLTARVLGSSRREAVGQLHARRDLMTRAAEPGVIEVLAQGAGEFLILRQMSALAADGTKLDRLQAIIIGHVSMRDLLETDVALTAASARRSVLLDDHGRVVARSYHQGEVDETFLEAAAPVAKGFEGTLTLLPGAAQETVAVFRDVPLHANVGWRLIHFQDSKSLLAPLLAGVNRLAMVGLALCITALGLAWLVARRIAHPFEQLTDVARRLGGGDYAVRFDGATRSSREFQALADTFNGMAEAVAYNLASLEHRVVERTAELARERDVAQRYLDIAGVMILALDAQGCITMVNKRGCELLGRSESGLLGHNWFDEFMPPDERETSAARFRRIMAGERALSRYYENRVVIPAGVRTMAWHNVPLDDAEGKLVGTLSSGEDITDRRRTEAELALHRNHLEALAAGKVAELNALFLALPDLYFRLGGDGRILDYRCGLQQELYAAPEVFLGKRMQDALPPEVGAKFDRAFAEMARDGTQQTIEYEMLMPQGQQIYEARVVPLPGGEMAAVVRNVSEIKRAEHALVASRAAAEAANRAKTVFLANMSHELRTPMNGVLGMIGLAKRSVRDPGVLDRLSKAEVSAQRLLGVLNDILDLSKVEADKLAIEHIPFNLVQVLEGVIAPLEHIAHGKQLQLLLAVPPALVGCGFVGDPLRLGQVLTNLTGNAIKFSSRGEIRVTVTRQQVAPGQAELRFEVIDEGIGIAKEDQRRLFVAFEQGDSSMTRKYGGTGLGLAICKRLVQLMGGSIGVDSTPGAGSRFWFTARVTEDAARGPLLPVEPVEDAEQALMRDCSGACVLVAEDEDINREIIVGLLADVGLDTDTASDGREAVSRALERRYDLILMDMQMPVLNGVEATRAIRADSANRDTPILALTANAFAHDRQVCLEAGMDAHLVKPVVPAVLYAALWSRLKPGARRH